MQMKGSVTEVKTVYVDIAPNDMIEALKARWKQNTTDRGEYINSDGQWETWHDIHGSGITEIHRQATDEEVRVWEAFKILSSLDFKLHK